MQLNSGFFPSRPPGGRLRPVRTRPRAIEAGVLFARRAVDMLKKVSRVGSVDFVNHPSQLSTACGKNGTAVRTSEAVKWLRRRKLRPTNVTITWWGASWRAFGVAASYRRSSGARCQRSGTRFPGAEPCTIRPPPLMTAPLVRTAVGSLLIGIRSVETLDDQGPPTRPLSSSFG